MAGLWKLLFFLIGIQWVSCSTIYQQRQRRHLRTITTEYNVFYPRSCTGSKCTLAIKWYQTSNPNWVNFTLMAKTRGDAVWAAVGFSENGRMSGSDVVTCWYHKNSYELFNAWNSDFGRACHIDKKQDIVQLHSGNYTDGLLACHFSRLKVLNTTSKFDKSLDSKWHILLAWGQLSKSDGANPSHMLQHASQYSTSCRCNVTNNTELCLCINEFKELLLKLHGTVMSVVFMLFVPTGAFIAKFYKQILPDSWFKSHMIVMSVGHIGMVAGLGLILGHTGGTFSVGPHQIIGSITLGLTAVQILIAVFRPPKGSSLLRKLFEYFHRINTVTILLLGTLSLALGSWLLHSSNKTVLIWMEAIISLCSVCSLSISAAMVIMKRFTECRAKAGSPPVRYHKVSEDTADTTEEDEVFVKDENNNFSLQHPRERTLLIAFVLQSFALSGLVSAFIFYNNKSQTD